MANIHFLRKIAVDELWDTMFFATGQRPVKEKTPNFYILKADNLELKIHSTNRVIVNGDTCRSVHQAKYAVAEILSLC